MPNTALNFTHASHAGQISASQHVEKPSPISETLGFSLDDFMFTKQLSSVMRIMILAVVMFLLSTRTAFSIPIVNLSTGSIDGGLIAYGSFDDQWNVVAAPSGIALVSATVVTPSRSHFANLEPDARWISVSTETNNDAPWGYYTYETLFNIDLNALSAVSVYGQYAADNRLIDIRLNGNVAFVGPNVSGVSCPPLGCEEFIAPISFSINDSSWFVNGLNVLQVTIDNQGPTFGNPTSFVFNAAVDAIQVPEPSSIFILLGGLGAMSLTRRPMRTRIKALGWRFDERQWQITRAYESPATKQSSAWRHARNGDGPFGGAVQMAGIGQPDQHPLLHDRSQH